MIGAWPGARGPVPEVVEACHRQHFGFDLRGGGTAWFDGLVAEADGHALAEAPAPHLLAPTPEHAAWLRDKARIGITGGTSTPEVDLEEVRDRIYALTAA